MDIIILAVQESATQDGYSAPLPYYLQELEGRLLIERITDSVTNLNPASISYVFTKKDIAQWNLDFITGQLYPNANLVGCERMTKGAACSALMACHHINPDHELLLLSTNEYIRQNLVDVINEFRSRNLSAGAITFTSINPAYAFVKLDEDRLVREVAEHRPISKNAVCGLFWYRRASDFMEAAKNVIRKHVCVNDRYYVSSTFNELLLEDARIGVFPIELSQYMPIKTQRQLDSFEAHNYVRSIHENI